MSQRATYADVVIIGGGFYGACLALFYRSVADNVIILEAEDDLLTRASFVNQARVHTGFHYPRSFLTARRSLALYQRFATDFGPAVVDDFAMLYAIARTRSKITAHRFEKMFADLGAPFEAATRADHALFDDALVEAVYRCKEFAFDAAKLRALLKERLAQSGVRVMTGARVTAVDVRTDPKAITVAVENHGTFSGGTVIDATYGLFSNRPDAEPLPFQLKFEQTEVALITPPAELDGVGITVMDGPFFSTMPFPAKDAYSLTHVRYTPHKVWLSGEAPPPASDRPQSRWLHMIRDSARFVPCIKDATWRESLFETKTVLLRNERDDGRPILLERHPERRNFMMVLGGKVDNIYDLFDALIEQEAIRSDAHTGFLTPDAARRAAP